jgi:hypothetical protein
LGAGAKLGAGANARNPGFDPEYEGEEYWVLGEVAGRESEGLMVLVGPWRG